MFDQNTPVDLYNVGKRCDGSSLFGGRTGTLYASELSLIHIYQRDGRGQRSQQLFVAADRESGCLALPAPRIRCV